MANTIIVRNGWTDEIEFEYTSDMEPEIFPPLNKGEASRGSFTIFYLSGYEEEDDTDWTECDYSGDYYAEIKED